MQDHCDGLAVLDFDKCNLAKRVYQLLREGYESDNTAGIVLIAPTGFGKTLISPYILLKAREDRLAFNLIHVAPTRALVREIYNEKFSWLQDLGLSVGYQSQDKLESVGKSPFYLRDVVVTTLDSFQWNIYRVPVAEVSKVVEGRSQGHYHPVLSSILTSITVLDEAHVYLGVGSMYSWTFMIPILSALKRYKVPFILETATFPSRLLERVLVDSEVDRSKVRVVYVCSRDNCNSQVTSLKSLGFRVDVVSPSEDYYSRMLNIKWQTKIARQDEAVIEARRLCKEKLVLAVFNTVDRAINFYKEMELCDKTLIHGLMSERDKQISYEKVRELRKKGRGAIVATQVVEVGVDVDAEVLISDIAPLENLVQRAGRLCRSGKRECSEPQLIFIEPSHGELGHGVYNRNLVERTLVELKSRSNVDWRLLDTRDGRVSYVDLLENIYDSSMVNELYKSVDRFLRDVAKHYLEGGASPNILVDFIEEQRAWSLFKSSYLIKLLVDGGDPQEDYIVTDIDRLLEFKDCLEITNDTVKIAVIAFDKGGQQSLHYINSKTMGLIISKGTGKKASSYKRFVEGLSREIIEHLPEKVGSRDFYIVLRSDCYKEGLGLRPLKGDGIV